MRSNRENAEKLLYSEEVETFVGQAEEAIGQSSNLDWDVISKVANIHYYRTYFPKGDTVGQAKRAIDWISRALLLSPNHADLTMKYAAMFAAIKDYAAAVGILERLLLVADAPLSVRQWLGFYLLFVPDRLDDAIKYSEQHFSLENDSDSLFNVACAYAQAYCRGTGSGKAFGTRQRYREQALSYIKQALERIPGYVTVVKKWTGKNESFECFAADPEFEEILNHSEVTHHPANHRWIQAVLLGR